MKKFLQITFKTLKILLAVLLVLYIAVYAYVSVNKASIIKQVTEVIGKKISGKVSVGEVELSFFRQFPKIAVLLNDISITDSLFATHNHVFFHASRLFARLSIMRLIQKEAPLNGLTIEKGEVYFFTDTSGYTNTYLIQKKNDSTAGKSVDNSGNSELKTIILKEVSFILDDRQKEKLHNYFINELKVKLDDTEDDFLLNVNGDIMIHSMAFNVPRGGFLKETKFDGRFDVRFSKKLNQLQFDSIDIKLAGQPFNLTGRFDLGADSPMFSLRAHTRQLLYEKGKAMVPKRIDSSLSLVQLDKPLDVDVSLDGPLKGGEPLIYINWVVKETQLKTPFLDFENASFTGFFTNEFVKGQPRLDPNSVISNSNFSAAWRGIPVKASNIEILNLFQPTLTCDLQADFPLTKLNDVTGSTFLQLQSGDGSVNLSYKGPIERNNNTNSFINGSVAVKNGTILYAPRDVALKDVSGELIFKNSDVLVKNLKCVVMNNKILMQGQAKNLLTLINTEPGKASIDWTISSPSLNLGSFVFLLKPEKQPVSSSGTKASLSATTSNIDEVLEKAKLHMNLDAASLSYRKFQANNLNADITLLANKYVINNVSMNHAGGSIQMKGSLLNKSANYLVAALNASMKNVDVSKVLYAFDNFGQDAITAQNLNGKLTTTIDATIGLDENGGVVPSSAKSIVDFSLKDGALINFEPVKKMQNFLFKKRDFDNIRFAELKDKLEIANGDIKINRMEIQSTVFSFFVEGVYGMKGNTDISIQVPFSNLKKRGADYNPENVGVDKKPKKSIYLRGRPGSDGNVSFKLDLFNKYKKEKEAQK